MVERPQPPAGTDEDLGRPDPLDIPELSQSMELVQRVQGGDQSALNDLFERYKPRLRRIVSVKLGSRLQRYLDEDDILQEVFIIAMSKIQGLELRSQASILQWLAKIALNEIRNKVEFHGAQKRDPQREVRLLDGSVTSLSGVRVPAREPTPSQKALRSEFEQLVDSYVEELEPPEYREVVVLRDYYEEPWEGIRAQLGRPSVPAVQELYRRAHLKLRERMRKHLER